MRPAFLLGVVMLAHGVICQEKVPISIPAEKLETIPVELRPQFQRTLTTVVTLQVKNRWKELYDHLIPQVRNRYTRPEYDRVARGEYARKLRRFTLTSVDFDAKTGFGFVVGCAEYAPGNKYAAYTWAELINGEFFFLEV